MSLREVGVRTANPYERGTRHRTGEHRRDQSNDVRQSRGQQQTQTNLNRTPGSGAHRQIGHQSSLRSLMSSSDIDSSEMEEEILRLVDEGWLDGVDLSTLDTSQVDELSERIADAYRRRHGHRSGARSVQTENTRHSQHHSRTRSRERSDNRSNLSSTATEQSHRSSRPPVSRPRLLEAYPARHGQQRRASSEQRRQTSPSPRSSTGRNPSGSQNQASRSATDLSERPLSSAPRTRAPELSSQSRRTTEPSNRHRERSRGDGRHNTTSAPSSRVSGEHQTRPVAAQSGSGPNLPPPASDPGHTTASNQPVIRENPSEASDTAAASTQEAPDVFADPSIECNRCGRRDIEYTLHYQCSICYDGKYNLCLDCYRLGRGCLHWYGFAYAALQKYQRDAKDLSRRKDASPPHALVGHRYKRPEPETVQPSPSGEGQEMTTQDPKARLQSGAFCSICQGFANHCFWKCDSCNEGEWGFCNQCVNQGRCCTHPLLPVAHKSLLNTANTDPSISSQATSFTPSPEHLLQTSAHLVGLSPPEQFVPLTLSTKCNICDYPIPPSSTRFHCPQCNDGDFNICMNSYLKLINTGRISVENGDKGWRRCPSGHRMIVFGFEDSPAGQRRVIVKDLVGGHGLKNDGRDVEQSMKEEWSWQDGEQRRTRTLSKHIAASETHDAGPGAGPLLRRYPPSGGTGMHVFALWSYWPREEAQDELPFPKGAEIREVENINGDWFVGCYAGNTGLFPGNYVRVLHGVRS